MQNIRRKARLFKGETLALYLAARDPRVPWYAKVLAAAIVAYALSPIDLIPDFIPILVYRDARSILSGSREVAGIGIGGSHG
jgi:uncharacterized membrane protein YkvA (DUF1232 family)